MARRNLLSLAAWRHYTSHLSPLFFFFHSWHAVVVEAACSVAIVIVIRITTALIDTPQKRALFGLAMSTMVMVTVNTYFCLAIGNILSRARRHTSFHNNGLWDRDTGVRGLLVVVIATPLLSLAISIALLTLNLMHGHRRALPPIVLLLAHSLLRNLTVLNQLLVLRYVPVFLGLPINIHHVTQPIVGRWNLTPASARPEGDNGVETGPLAAWYSTQHERWRDPLSLPLLSHTEISRASAQPSPVLPGQTHVPIDANPPVGTGANHVVSYETLIFWTTKSHDSTTNWTNVVQYSFWCLLIIYFAFVGYALVISAVPPHKRHVSV